MNRLFNPLCTEPQEGGEMDTYVILSVYEFVFRWKASTEISGLKSVCHVNNFVSSFVKLHKAIIGFVMSVRPYGTTWLPLETFSLNLISENFSKICRENSNLIKTGKEELVFYMETDVHF